MKLYTIPESNIARENCLTNGCFGLRGAIDRIVHDLVWFIIQMLHVWNFYLQNWLIFGVSAGKYSSTMEHLGHDLSHAWGVQETLLSGGAVPLRTSRDWNLRPVLGGASPNVPQLVRLVVAVAQNTVMEMIFQSFPSQPCKKVSKRQKD